MASASTDASASESDYSNVVDMVEAGADPNGNESITSVVQQNIAEDTLLKFPEGEYYMDDQVRFTGFNNVGIVGDGATLVPADYHTFGSSRARLFRLGTNNNPGGSVWFEGFEVDQTASDTGIRVISAEVTDELVVRDVFVHGVHDSGTWGPALFNITDPDGSGIIDCFHAFDGAVHVDETPNSGRWRGATGIVLNGEHQGDITFKDCILGGFPGTGLYASGNNGRISVEGGWYENSATASIRLSGNEGSIENTIIAVDENNVQANGQHAIRLDQGNQFTVSNVTVDVPQQNGEAIRIMGGAESTTIANTRVVAEGQSAAIRVDDGAGEVDFVNSEVEINGSSYAFRILGDSPGAVSLEDVSVVGDAGGSPIQPAIFCERNNCQFEGLSVEQLGEGRRRGIELRGSDYLIADSEFETSRIPITVHNGSDVTIENTTAEAADGSSSVRIHNRSGSVSMENNEFPGGVDDRR
ncbi:right-handed parallel beta-helix repeat-containing protein [Natronococcus sp. A-GB7]|uniref:right-handed parallel beta-helix repeat-containing protein n=1 Tax=Natronococcus sp. A-GB7 TaxID=3037649 RepID=UPI00241CD1E2|nr:right-handed parallel beta-helix repeat-containing protein [Natronococcus sp. A-GB7]MDG5819041.1 right-handed parallel beta-helix repeat-containing protein [Natronococcus sp. A-GB7]